MRGLGRFRLGRRGALAAALAVVLLAAAWYFLLRVSEVEPRLTLVRATAVIGSGEDAVGVGPDGSVLDWQAAPPEGRLPRLPLAEPPEAGVLAGPALQQALVLGAAPRPLLPCVEETSQGEFGVIVELRSGIELHFGNASRAADKWRSAATVLADPSTVAADYVDLHSPRHPAVHGEGHTLPSPEEAAGARCGE